MMGCAVEGGVACVMSGDKLVNRIESSNADS